jgi:hypothetical protein
LALLAMVVVVTGTVVVFVTVEMDVVEAATSMLEMSVMVAVVRA